MRRLVTALALIPALGVPPLAAQTQMPCAPRDQALAHLEARGQHRYARGLAGRAMIEIFVNPGTEEWSMTLTLPEGRTCLMANGIAFQSVPPVQEGVKAAL